MKKTRLVSKFLLICIFSSYLQFIPAFSQPAFAQEASEETCLEGTVNTCVLADLEGLCSIGNRVCLADGSWDDCSQSYSPKSEICDNNLDDDCDGFEDAEDPDCGLAFDLEKPNVEIYAEEGVLKYRLLNEDEYAGLDVEYKVEWLEKILLEDGGCQENIISTENDYRPENSGTFIINFTISVQTDQEKITLSAEDEYVVNFPIIDKTQFQDLNYRAGERFTLKYFDESGAISDLIVRIGDSNVLTKKVEETNYWEIVGTEITKSGNYKISLNARNEDGFESIFSTNFFVSPNEVNAANSKFEILQNGDEVSYVPTGSEPIKVKFTAYDEYLNGINVENLDRVDIRFNGELLEGTDLIGSNKFTVERILAIPNKEDLNSVITVDVFDSECDGEIFINDKKVGNYCFGKTKNLLIYDEYVSPVENLTYVEKTRENTVTITGEKKAGYGIKINSVDAGFTVNADDNTSFSFALPLAEGMNGVQIYAVKVVTDELTFYSNPVELAIEKDTRITPPVWNDPAITLDGDNQATLHWTDPIYLTGTDNDFSHVNIYRSTIPNFVPSAENLVIQTHNPSWTDTGLTPGVKYYYLIEAVDDVGNTAMIKKAQSTGTITGNSEETGNVDDNWYDNLFAGKGIYDEGKSEGEEILSEETTDGVKSENGEQEDELMDDSGIDEDTEKDGEESWVNNFFKKAGNSLSSLYRKLSSNIFVQICCGGILIFVALMILISVLVWLKEKFIDKSSVANLVVESEKVSKPKKAKSKNKKKKKK